MIKLRIRNTTPPHCGTEQRSFTRQQLAQLVEEALIWREVACAKCHYTAQLRKVRLKRISRGGQPK
jgi:hypothetical protein